MNDRRTSSPQSLAYRRMSRIILTLVTLGGFYVFLCQCSNRVTVVNLSSSPVTLRFMERQEEIASSRTRFEPADTQQFSSESVIAPLGSRAIIVRNSLTLQHIVVLNLKLPAAQSNPQITLSVLPWGARDFIECRDGQPGFRIRNEATILCEMYWRAKRQFSVLSQLP